MATMMSPTTCTTGSTIQINILISTVLIWNTAHTYHPNTTYISNEQHTTTRLYCSYTDENHIALPLLYDTTHDSSELTKAMLNGFAMIWSLTCEITAQFVV